MIPCCIRAMNDIKAEFSVYSTNGYENKSPYEKMKEIEGMARLMKELKAAQEDATIHSEDEVYAMFGVEK